ncbi:MAG: DUF2099 family protein [Thermoplasmatales archaeon]|nr:DUF2099 family protein [Thermoplasmatales archaeon]
MPGKESRKGGRHVMEALGMSRVVIEDGKVVEISEPIVKYCPLFHKHRGIEELNEESIRKNMQFRVDDFGMCTDSREIRLGYFLNFGISEIMSLAVSRGLLDAVVIAADGCGTAVLRDPEIIQGMGGRISGIVETCPEPSVIEGIGPENVLSPETAEINQFGGVHKAFAMGNKRVGVTVASAGDARAIRDCFGDNVVIFAVHTTGVTEEEAGVLYDVCDVITSCASKPIRELAKERAVLQAGTKVPVYAASQRGAELMKAKLDELGREPDTVLESSPEPLI